MFHPDDALSDHALRLCQSLVRLDTSNPPGRERPAADLLAGELADAGLDPVVLESAPGRGNVVARWKGTGERPPLLLAAHLDVVEADPDGWTHHPFAGDLADGFLWGRGAVDMKNMAAMSVALLCRLAREKVRLRRDLIFAGVADEEAGCDYGSAWLCANHPELVRAEYALGEAGGFNIHLGGRNFFTVQVAEKGICWVRARVRSTPGHGSMPREDSAVIKLADAIRRLGTRRLPVHPTSVVTAFFEEVLRNQPRPLPAPLARWIHPSVVAAALRALPDKSLARGIHAMLSNTASPTVVRAGNKINVIPGVAEVDIDGRTLPGQTTEDFLRELSEVLGPEVELEVLRAAPPTVTEPMRSPLFDTIVSVLRDREPDAVVVPYLMPGFTDAKYFSRLGIKWYGFSPVKLPRGLRFAELYHGVDERIPVEGLRWGTAVLADVVTRFAG